MYTAPTPTRRDKTVSSRRRRRCVLGFNNSAESKKRASYSNNIGSVQAFAAVIYGKLVVNKVGVIELLPTESGLKISNTGISSLHRRRRRRR